MTIFEWIRLQGRAVLPMEVKEVFPHRTAKQICDSLDDYYKRGKLDRVPIPNTVRRFRYKAVGKLVDRCERREKFSKSEINPAVLPLIRM